MEECLSTDEPSILAQARQLRETWRNRALENATIEEELAQEKEELLKQRLQLPQQKNNSLSVESPVESRRGSSRRASVWKSAPPEVYAETIKTDPVTPTKDPPPKHNLAQVNIPNISYYLEKERVFVGH
jgi:hypothetical protein